MIHRVKEELVLIFGAVLVKFSFLFRLLGDLVLPRACIRGLTIPTLVSESIMVVTTLDWRV